MSPRARKVSDDDVFAAAYRAMSRLGPGELTLAEIAADAGVTASAIVQRFGSKHALLVALAERAANTAEDVIAEIQARHRSPLAALREYADCMAHMASSPAALVRSLAYLQIDLTDPDLRRPLVIQARATRAGLERLVAAAVAAGELSRATRPDVLARTIEVVLSGSLMTWAFYQDGSAARWLRNDLDAVLAPYRAKRRRRG